MSKFCTVVRGRETYAKPSSLTKLRKQIRILEGPSKHTLALLVLYYTWSKVYSKHTLARLIAHLEEIKVICI